MDQLEIDFYSAIVIYGQILIWTALARLRWLPSGLVRLVHRPLNSLERIPVLSHGVRACRKHALSLGLVPAILVGVSAPFVFLFLVWIGYWLALGIIIVLSAWAFFNGSEERELEQDPYGMYVEKSGQGLAYGDSPRADTDRPLP